ncbi:MAG TPA: hypothetical protein VFK69_13045 [Candidatus Eisenbacteria bacterium]|nr:hypothetical protein [Candidatus Eisenbacteria bacterium]
MYDVNAAVRPKDFALLYTPGKFHLFYIRHNSYADVLYGNNAGLDSTERNLGHMIMSDTWDNWHTVSLPRDTSVLQVRNGQAGDTIKWDNWHVWAPTIIKSGITYYLFYTGVNRVAGGQQNQMTGVATSTDLVTWTRRDTAVYSVRNVAAWADTAPLSWSSNRSQQFRDPYIMPDPVYAGRYLMYYSTVLKNTVQSSSGFPSMVVGVARSVDSLGGAWSDLGPLRSTDIFNNSFHSVTGDSGSAKIESPHLFFHQEGTHPLWRLVYTTGGGHPIFIQYVDNHAPYDTLAADSSHWVSAGNLFNVLHQDSTVQKWVGSEYLEVGQREFLAAYDTSWISVAQMTWAGTVPDHFSLGYPAASVDRRLAVDGGEVHLHLEQAGHQWAAFAVDLPRSMEVTLSVYDVFGRRIRTLLHGPGMRGTTLVRWDGRGTESGMYFARLTCPGGACSLKMVLLH